MKVYRSNRTRLLPLLLIVFCFPAVTRLAAQSGWSTAVSGTAAGLNRIYWSASDEFPGLLRVVGDSGTFLQSDDGGESWTKPPLVPTGLNLNSLDFPYPDTGYVVGDSGMVFRVVRMGEVYEFTATGPPGPCDMNGVSSIPLSVSAYAVGDCGTILRTVTRGQTWVAYNSGTTRNINAVKMATVSRIFACGDSGLILLSTRVGLWATLQPGPAYGTPDFNAIAISGSLGDTVWMAGENGTILRSRNTGSSWQGLQSGVTVTLHGIFHHGRYNQTGTLWAVGDSGVILRSTDSGDNWTRQESGTSENLRDIFFSDAMHGYIVGENGTILRTSTGGEYRPLSCSPKPMDFGPVVLGSTKSGTMTVWNSSDAPVDVEFALSSNPRFSVSPAAATVPARGKQTFTVDYSPATKTTDISVITVVADTGEIVLRDTARGMGVDSLAQPAWTWLNPRPQGTMLNDIAFFDTMNGIAVGEAGTIIRTTDGGGSWTTIHYAAGLNTPLTAVEILDAQSAVAAGAYGLVLRTSDRGANWSVMAGPGPVERLASLAFSGTDTGYAVGWDGTIYDVQVGSIHRTTDGGATWETQVPRRSELDGETIFDVPIGIAAVTPELAVAVGWMWSADQGTLGGYIFRTTDGGEHWKRSPSASNPLIDVSFADQSTGIAVGTGGTILRTTNGGADWGPVSSPMSQTLYRVAFTGSDDGIALGLYGEVLTTHDGGLTWTLRPQPAEVYTWSAIARTGPYGANALGGRHIDYRDGPGPTYYGVQPVLYSTTDAGETWESRFESVVGHSLRGVSFRDANNGAAISDRGDILVTTDGGATWRLRTEGTLLEYEWHPFTSVSCFQPDNIVIAGMYGTILHSTDGGNTWIERSGGTTAMLNAVTFGSPAVGYIVGSGGTILRTTDSGNHWMSQTTSYTDEFRGVAIVDDTLAVVVGTSGIMLRTTDGGRIWDRVTDGTSRTWNDVTIQALSGIAVGDSGAVAVTTDGGASWQPVDPGTTESFLGISLSGSGMGLAVGSGGTMIATTDAGASWTTSPSGTNILLYDVGFVNDLEGTVVGGAGLVLRTTTGGMPATGLTAVRAPALPGSYRLDQNYPNPFNPVTTIRYNLPAESRVVLKIYDMLGRVVATLVDAVQPPGERRVLWNARGMASGVYFYRLEAIRPDSPADPYTREFKMVLVR